jgi:hypothetical protein
MAVGYGIEVGVEAEVVVAVPLVDDNKVDVTGIDAVKLLGGMAINGKLL